MAIDLVKENIEYDKLIGENKVDNVIKSEYVIPDTLPDVKKILMVDVKPVIKSKELMQNKIYVEGQILFNVIYLSKEEQEDVFSVSYEGKFSNYIELDGTENKMNCACFCQVEQMLCNVINERKIQFEGIIKTLVKIRKICSIDMIKHITEESGIELLKNQISLDKIAIQKQVEIPGKAEIVIPMDKPKINSVLKIQTNLHKREIEVVENQVRLSAFVFCEILYKGNNIEGLQYTDTDVFINEDIEAEGLNGFMEGFGDFEINNVEYTVREDDLGERRIIDIDFTVLVDFSVRSKENIDVIEDAYSSELFLDIVKEEHEFDVIQGEASVETIVKENIRLTSDKSRPVEILLPSGRVCVTDKKLVDNKVIIDGLLQVKVLYKTEAEGMELDFVEEEIPFSCTLELQGAKIDMNSEVKLLLESLEASLEAGTIAIKSIICAEARANYCSKKQFIMNIDESEGAMPIKKSSITIYCVQPGDTLWQIAKKFCTPLEVLVKTNNIENIDSILIGQKLLVPGRAII